MGLQGLLICPYFLNANSCQVSFSFSTVWVGGHLEKGGGGVSPAPRPLVERIPQVGPRL